MNNLRFLEPLAITAVYHILYLPTIFFIFFLLKNYERCTWIHKYSWNCRGKFLRLRLICEFLWRHDNATRYWVCNKQEARVFAHRLSTVPPNRYLVDALNRRRRQQWEWWRIGTVQRSECAIHRMLHCTHCAHVACLWIVRNEVSSGAASSRLSRPMVASRDAHDDYVI